MASSLRCTGLVGRDAGSRTTTQDWIPRRAEADSMDRSEKRRCGRQYQSTMDHIRPMPYMRSEDATDKVRRKRPPTVRELRAPRRRHVRGTGKAQAIRGHEGMAGPRLSIDPSGKRRVRQAHIDNPPRRLGNTIPTGAPCKHTGDEQSKDRQIRPDVSPGRYKPTIPRRSPPG